MQTAKLPYVDNAKAIIITAAINLGVVFLFNWPNGITYSGVMWDSLICAFITVAIDMWIVYARMSKMRANGEMPAKVPESKLMQRLTQNPLRLGAIYAVVFAAITVAANGLILWFFGMWSMAFLPWVVYKLIYATLLSARIVEFCIFRYVQPDWAKTGNTDTETETKQSVQIDVNIKNPMPKISVFKEMYGGVTGNIAMNIILGSALGGVVIGADSSVIINPTTVEGIPITGLVFGLIVGILVTRGIVAEMNKTIMSYPAMAETAVADKRFTWMPVKKASLTRLVCACMMIFSAVALPSIMAFFGKSALNFYQFCVFITAYATLISKPLSYILMRRCLQPDYIQHVLNHVNQ